MGREIKAWRCANGHVMGQVERNGSGIRMLILYRIADPDEVDVIAVIEGRVVDVRCSVCGSARTWVPGQEALDQLVKRTLKLRESTQASG